MLRGKKDGANKILSLKKYSGSDNFAAGSAARNYLIDRLFSRFFSRTICIFNVIGFDFLGQLVGQPL